MSARGIALVNAMCALVVASSALADDGKPYKVAGEMEAGRGGGMWLEFYDVDGNPITSISPGEVLIIWTKWSRAATDPKITTTARVPSGDFTPVLKHSWKGVGGDIIGMRNDFYIWPPAQAGTKVRILSKVKGVGKTKGSININ